MLRTATLALTALAIVGALGAVLLSPIALSQLSSGEGIDWGRLSDVGQTYGAASAVLSVLALSGVAVSLHLQRRESKAAREQALRGLHSDLLKMALDDPTFLACWGPIGSSVDMNWYRQHIYLNLIVSHWQMTWEIGALSEAHLRFTAAGMFGGPLGRRYWAEAREPRRSVEKGRRARTFFYIVDDEYHAALARLDGDESTATQPENIEDERDGKPGARADQREDSTAERMRRKPVDSRFSRLTPTIYIAAGAAVGVIIARMLREVTREK